MTPEDNDMMILLTFIVGAILFLIVWDWYMNRMFNKTEPKPIARERKDLRQKVRI